MGELFLYLEGEGRPVPAFPEHRADVEPEAGWRGDSAGFWKSPGRPVWPLWAEAACFPISNSQELYS